jgi:hypothetical protein
MPQPDKILRATIVLMYGTAVFWVIFATLWLFRDSDYRFFYFVSGVGYAIFIAILAYLLNKRRLWAWWLTVIFACLNIILTFADQVGWFDFAYLVPAIGLLVMLVMAKRSIFSTSVNTSI